MLDGMIGTVALPAIERDLGTAHADLQWVVTAYTLSLGSFLLVGGRAGDLYGRRRTLVAGLVVFAVASLAAGLAPSTGALLGARAVQGLGAALAVPAALALLAAAYRSQRERERAVGLMSAVLDAGMVGGLVLGGLLTATLGWPWCFFIVVPFGLAAAALAPSVLEESRDDAAPRCARRAAGCSCSGSSGWSATPRPRSRSSPAPPSSSPASSPSSGEPKRRWCGSTSSATAR
jgi:MFS family permease